MLIPVALVAPAVAPAARATGAPLAKTTVIAQEISDPDAFTCPGTTDADPASVGYVGFEDVSDGTSLGDDTVAGLNFNGWTVGDFATGVYDGKYPAGDFSSEQTHFATTTSTQPTITLDHPASTFGLLVSADSNVALQTLNSNGRVTTKTPLVARNNGRHMVQFEINRPTPDISAAQLVFAPSPAGADAGPGFFTIDSVCTDANKVPRGQITLTVGDGAPGSASAVHGYGFEEGESVHLDINGQDAGVSNPVGADGQFDLPIVLPNAAQPGSDEITATGLTSNLVATANYLVHTDWVERGFEAGRTNENLTENTLGPGNVGALRPIWSATVGGSRAAAVAVAIDNVYVNSLNDTAYAFRENSPGPTPDLVGHVATGNTLTAAPAIDDDNVYIASQDGHIYAYDHALQKLRWRFPDTDSSNLVFTRSPVMLFGTLYENDTAGDVFAINKSNGIARTFTLPGSPTARSDLAIDHDGTNIYVATVDGHIYAYNRQTLTPAWKQPAATGGLIHADPIVVGRKVIIGSDDGRIYAFRATDGSLAWRTNVIHQFGIADSLAANEDGVFFVGSRDLHGYLQARSVLTGHLLWEHKTGAPIETQPAIANGVVYVTSSNGHLLAFQIAPRGKRLLDLPVAVGPAELSAPVIANGAVYIGTGDGKVVKYGI